MRPPLLLYLKSVQSLQLVPSSQFCFFPDNLRFSNPETPKVSFFSSDCV